MKNFLSHYINEKMYIENPPLETEKFIKFCEICGIITSKEELEFFEKKELLYPIIRIDRPIFSGENGKYYSDYHIFEEDRHDSTYFFDLIRNWYNNGVIYHPTQKQFKSWDQFKSVQLNNEDKMIVSFYSNFQIILLEKIKEYNLNSINFSHEKTDFRVEKCDTIVENEKTYLELNLNIKIKVSDTDKLPIIYSNPDIPLDYKKLLIEKTNSSFDFEIKKRNFIQRNRDFHGILKFLLSVQSVYIPYAHSGGGKVTHKSRKWFEIKSKFNLKKILTILNIKFLDVVQYYQQISEICQNILGSNYDWVQLWKNISWQKKQRLHGNLRLGVEYLGWGIMLKKTIEEYLSREIPDIDEISNLHFEDIITIDLEDTTKNHIHLRALRNLLYSDNVKSFYH
ncbi:MAG: hypothetical protein PHH55_07710, partial [Candidatus Delongbacteria bacterium]|nr:hypothetical protein [Candidatus Delongbacteria bacterium]